MSVVTQESEEYTFEYEGVHYIAYSIEYSNGERDIEVFNIDVPDAGVDGAVWDYADGLIKNS